MVQRPRRCSGLRRPPLCSQISPNGLHSLDVSTIGCRVWSKCQDWCTGSLKAADLSGEFLLNRTIVLHRFAVPEGNTLQQQLDLFGAVDAAPGFLGFLDQVECQTK